MTQDPSAKARETVREWLKADFTVRIKHPGIQLLEQTIAAALAEADQRGYVRGVEAAAKHLDRCALLSQEAANMVPSADNRKFSLKEARQYIADSQSSLAEKVRALAPEREGKS